MQKWYGLYEDGLFVKIEQFDFVPSSSDFHTARWCSWRNYEVREMRVEDKLI